MHCTASKPVDKTFDEPLDNQSLQTEWKSAPLAKVQLSEYENQTLEAFVVASCAKFDWPVRIFTVGYYALIAKLVARQFVPVHVNDEPIVTLQCCVRVKNLVY